MRSLAAAFAFLLVAGCVEPSSPSTSAPEGPVAALGAASVPFFAGVDCLQHHAYFLARAADFAARLPPGFSIPSDAAGTFDLRLEFTRCASPEEADPSHQLWIELPVVPPPEIAVPDHGHVLPIEAYFGSEALRSIFENHSVAFAEGCHCATTTLVEGPVLVDEVVSHSLAGAYELRALMEPGSGPFEDARSARYIAADGEVVAILVATQSEATNRGAGPVCFHYNGPGGAPPAHDGIIHSIQGATVTIEARSVPS